MSLARYMYQKIWGFENPAKLCAGWHRYYEANRESVRRTTRTRQTQNPEYFRAASRKHYNQNRGSIIAASVARRRALTPEKRAAIYRRYADRHPSKLRANEQLRRARKLKAIIGNPRLIAKIYARAAELRQWFDVVVDHIIPLARGGSHSPDNLQIIYAKENARKGTRLDYVPSVVFA